MKIRFTNNSIVNSAEYGKNDTYVIVIDIINTLILDKVGIIVVSNNTFYIDPVYLTVKELKITIDSIPYIIEENDVLIIEYDTNNMIKDIIFDLERMGSTIYGISSPIFVTDPISNRDGWYYNNNSDNTKTSIITWYNNTKEITMSKLNSFYCIISMDTLNTSFIYLTITTKPLDDGNDANINYRTKITYTIPTTTLLYSAEMIMLYMYERPMIHSELRAIELEIGNIDGLNELTEIINNITINTIATTDTINYMVHYTGFIDSDINHIIQYKFENSIERIGKNNLALVNKYGYKGNIYTGDLTPENMSIPFDCSRYSNNSVITYEDTNITQVGNILFFACGEDELYVCIGILQPIVSISKRYGSSNIRLGAFKFIYMLNNSISETHTDIMCSLYSS